ncbi:MAG: 4Fe-4S dicluster domain-containing protein [Deltaproteobacteria bacterium]|nr:4Fe-4S dicluster domain-containing protein [Deltaproteobacteria bacterium]
MNPTPALDATRRVKDFADQVKRLGDADVRTCYQCKKCSAGCPVAFAMDYMPHQVIRMVQMGYRDQAVRCSTIWVCASCETCTTRCPNEVDIARVMDVLRQMALEEQVPEAEREIHVFHNEFLRSIRSHGRVFELGLIGLFKLRTGRFFDDILMGWKMFRKGKLSLLPHRVRDRDRIGKIFDRAKKGAL